MGEVKDLNIKNRTYYYFDDMIDIKRFEPNLLKIDKKSHRDFDIYYICYDTIKKYNNYNGKCIYKNIRSVNPLYLLIYSATEYFKEKNSKTYLILDPIEKYEEVLSEIRSEIKTINIGKELFYEKNYAKIRATTNDDVPMNKLLTFSTLIIIIRCVFRKGEELDPLIHLDECLYELQNVRI